MFTVNQTHCANQRHETAGPIIDSGLRVLEKLPTDFELGLQTDQCITNSRQPCRSIFSIPWLPSH